MAEATGSSKQYLLEVMLDDLSPEYFELLTERLQEAGASSVEQLPAISSADRPGYLVRAVAPAECRDLVGEAFIIHSTAEHVRIMPFSELRAATDFRSVTTRWGEARLRLKIWRGIVIDARPVYADVAQLAREAEAPLQVVIGEATRLGEVFIGQRHEGEPE